MDTRIESLGDGDEVADAPEALKATWAAWLPQLERHDPNHSINAVGWSTFETVPVNTQ